MGDCMPLNQRWVQVQVYCRAVVVGNGGGVAVAVALRWRC